VPTVTETPDEPLPKPDELLALDAVAEEMFETLRRWFDVPPRVPLDLRAVDSAVVELGEPVMIAAVAMRKLQALHLLATPGVRAVRISSARTGSVVFIAWKKCSTVG